jgi:ABC-type transport system involved in cytochrome c biogenesis ATPase subunit
MAAIEVAGVRKNYGAVQVLHGMDLVIADGEFIVLVGPSGCGKSTLLRMIAGLEEISAGTIRIGGRVVNDLPPKDRDIAMVFQSYALYPHMSVAENMSYSLRLRRTPKERIAEAVRGAAETLGLDQLLERRPKALSGGQRQRDYDQRLIEDRSAPGTRSRSLCQPACSKAGKSAVPAISSRPEANLSIGIAMPYGDDRSRDRTATGIRIHETQLKFQRDAWLVQRMSERTICLSM